MLLDEQACTCGFNQCAFVFHTGQGHRKSRVFCSNWREEQSRVGRGDVEQTVVADTRVHQLVSWLFSTPAARS